MVSTGAPGVVRRGQSGFRGLAAPACADVSRLFRATSPGDRERPGPRRATPAAVVAVLILFNAGWIVSIALWLFVMSGDANSVVNAQIKGARPFRGHAWRWSAAQPGLSTG